jgi:hypothetical protein
VGFAYVMNKLDFYLFDDPREKALRDALYRAIARLERIAGDDQPRAGRYSGRSSRKKAASSARPATPAFR